STPRPGRNWPRSTPRRARAFWGPAPSRPPWWPTGPCTSPDRDHRSPRSDSPRRGYVIRTTWREGWVRLASTPGSSSGPIPIAPMRRPREGNPTMLTSQTIENPFHEAGIQESRPMIVLEEDPVRGGNSVAATVHDVRVRVVGAVVGGLLLGL